MDKDAVKSKNGNLPRLKAVHISNRGEHEDRLIGIQLEFTGNITSPIICAEGMKEDSLMKFSMNASAFVSQISVRVDGNNLNEIKLSGKKVLIYSGLFQEQGELLVQHLKKP